MNQQDCLFCKIKEGVIPSDKVYEDELCLAFRDINPQAPTHILIIPKEHIETIDDLQEKHKELSGHLILTAKKLAENEGFSNEGYRLVFNCKANGGQEVYHIHLHLFGGRKMSWPPG